MTKKEQKIMISLRLHKELYDFIKTYSTKDYTTISNYITRLIIKEKNKCEIDNDNR